MTRMEARERANPLRVAAGGLEVWEPEHLGSLVAFSQAVTHDPLLLRDVSLLICPNTGILLPVPGAIAWEGWDCNYFIYLKKF